MQIGLRAGTRGENVRRLQGTLLAAGRKIARAEIEHHRFGASTLAALQAFQAEHGLRKTRQINRETLELLLEIEENITININEAPAKKGQPKTDATRGVVQGKLVDQDAAPIASTKVSLFSEVVQSETVLGTTKTDAQGQYKIAYRRPQALNLLVRAYDALGKVLVASQTHFAAAAKESINLTTAADGVVRPQSILTVLKAAIAAQLKGTTLVNLTENQTTHQLTFLAKSIGEPLDNVAYLYIAQKLARAHKLQDTTLFAFFFQSIPISLDAALASLPEAGIDDAFEAQVLSGVLAHTDAALTTALTAAFNANVIPGSYTAIQASEIAIIDTLRANSVASAPYIRGKTALSDLLGASNVAANVQSAFIQAYAASGQRLGETWKALRADKSLAPEDLDTLNTTLSIGELLNGNLVLVKDTLQRLATGSLASVQNLALLDQNDWVARIAALDPTASSVPPVLPNDTPELRIARLAKALAERFAGRYPGTAFLGGLTKATASSFGEAQSEMVSFLSTNANLNLKTANLDHYIATNKLTITAPTLTAMKTAQRLLRISPHYTSVEALNGAGFSSAQSIYFTGRTTFLAKMTQSLGSASLASTAFARAQLIYANALHAFGRYHLALNGINFGAMASATPDPTATANYPDLQALFGSLDYFRCADCQSVYSPAAYLVDLLQYLLQFPATPAAGTQPPLSTVTNARDALLVRRPEIQYVALDCNNTEITVCYIDLVNEILEAAISPPNPAVMFIDTVGTSAERRALPQNISQNAYTKTQAISFPLELPFDLPFAQTIAYLAALGTSRAAVLTLFLWPATPAGNRATACSSLGINPEMEQVIITADTTDPWTRWGFSSANPSPVIDPKTRQIYSPNPTDWVAALSSVPLLMNRTGLKLPQLYQLLEVVWVTQGSVQLQLGVNPDGTLSSDIEKMTFNGTLTAPVLDAANRFLRLWTLSGLKMWELDWALDQAAGGAMDDAFLIRLSGALTVQKQLRLPFHEALTFWGTIETRDVTSHLGKEDKTVRSTYSEVFLNPTVQKSWSSVFVAASSLSGSPIISTAQPPDTTNLNAITAALGLDAADIQAIFDATSAANALQLNTLTVLFRYARLVSSLSLSVSDLVLWIQLTAQDPFAGGPPETLEFLRRLALLRGTSLNVHDLDYLLRHQSVSQSSLAFTTVQATAVLQSIHDAIVKLPSTAPIPISAASNASPISISTVVPHGLTTGTQVIVTSVGGNTAANGSFSITVTGPTNFTLDGSTGNGTWTSGGSITVNTGPAIQTIFIAALATATGASGNVVSTALQTIGILPLAPATITSLLIQPASGVDPTQFTGLVNAFTSVSKAAAIFKALTLSEVEFTFISQNAGIFNWLNPCALPTQPQTSSPYVAFEALIRAATLDHRQPALSPKLFDIFTQWPTTITVGGTWVANQVYSFTLVGPQSQTVAISYASVAADANGSGVALSLSSAINASAAVIGAAAFLAPASAVGSVITINGLSIASLGYAVVNPGATGTGTIQPAFITAPFAFAMNANVADVVAVVTALGAQGPSVNPATQSGTVCDTAMLTAISGALNLCARYGIGGATLVELAADAATADTASAAMGVFQAQYSPSNWLAAVQNVEDNLRQQRRDALVAYILGAGLSTVPVVLLSIDDIFDYFLIDPEMCPCGLTTRLLQASLAIQQFVQQAFLNLSFQITINTTQSQWSEWSWRQQYELWTANRQVFLYPENYLLPELRLDASPFFSDLENDLRQTDCDADAAEAAFQNYLRKLVEVSNLYVAAHYNETKTDGSLVLHVFARTSGMPPKWYYRNRTTMQGADGVWTAWQQLNLDIHSSPVIPVIWDRRLFLFWPNFKQQSEQASGQSVPKGGGGQSPPPHKYWAVEFSYSDFSAGQWQPKRTVAGKMFFDTSDSPLAFTFTAAEDAKHNLQIQCYYNAIAEATAAATAEAEIEAVIDVAKEAVDQALSWSNNISPTSTKYTVSASAFGSSAKVTVGVSGFSIAFDTVSTFPASGLAATGMMAMPESPLVVTEDPGILPSAAIIDQTQEPTYAWVNQTSFYGTLTPPQNYGYCAQDLIFGTYSTVRTGSVTLDILSQSTPIPTSTSIPLLKMITNPRMVISQQPSFYNSTDPFLEPFFVSDPNRTYLVSPEFFTVSSSPEEIEAPGSPLLQWSTYYNFQSFYHPYARTLLRELEIGGVPQLMARQLQLNPLIVRGYSNIPGYPTIFDFKAIYSPEVYVATPYPGAPGAVDVGETALDFGAPGISAAIGAYTLYNWEIFYHVPMFVATLLSRNQQYTDAMTWLKYIFNPGDNSGGTTPQRFWEMAPFYSLNATGANSWQSQQIENILNSGIGDPATQAAILNWQKDPFDPHAVASYRIAAYGKATVMKFLDNLIAWADSLYTAYTMENVSQAEQLYIIADLILGPAPIQLPLPSSYVAASQAQTYASLQNISQFSDTLISIENLIVSPTPPQSLIDGTADSSTMPQFPSTGKMLLFCVPPNPQLLSYWTTVAQRLYNIRHCLNLQGIAQPLPLYGPAINPLSLIGQKAGGAGSDNSQTFAPIYRFAVYLQKAIDLTNDVRSFGSLILSALEKKDAEHLAALRATQDVNIQTMMLDVKNQQVTEAQDQIVALQNQQQVVKLRYNYYSGIAFMNAWETAAMAIQGVALITNGLAIILDMTAGGAHLVPSFSIGMAGFGGSPSVNASFGGENVASAASSWGSVTRGLAGILGEAGAMASTLGGYHRRADDWALQASLANAELTQIASQITAATDRLNIANSEVGIQNQQIANAQDTSDFLTSKYTNEQLYDWMLSQLTTVYTQAYQLAVGLARQAERVYQYELGNFDTFIQYGYWDSQYKGLTAGESLLFDLRRMEAQYLAENSRELELTKHISLAITQPTALVQLLETGICNFSFDEALFDHDHPGHYFRRLRSVALTIPCVTGPYTGINANLILDTAITRISSTIPNTGYTPVSCSMAGQASSPLDDTITFSVTNPGTRISTSTGQNDFGLFDVNLNDERWLPFEGFGAICAMTMEFDRRDNDIDFSTVTDIVITLRYTARPGIDEPTVRTALTTTPNLNRSILVSVRHTFGSAYYNFLNPAGTTPTQQLLTLPFTNVIFPYSNLGTPTISDIRFYVIPTEAGTGAAITGATFGQTGASASTPVAFNAAPNAEIPVLSGAGSNPLAFPIGSLTLALPAVNGQLQLPSASVNDIILIINYSIIPA